MNIIQAIHYWIEFLNEIEELKHTPGTDPEEWDKQEKATKLAITALLKQEKLEATDGNYCPTCEHKLFLQRQEYCSYCGQAIRRAE